MPRFYGVRERRDKCFYDTHIMEPGQELRFMGYPDCQVGEYHRTNMEVVGQLASDQTAIIFAIGLRLIGLSRDEEDLLLDHFMVTPSIGYHSYGPYPGNVCSTLRYVNEEDAADPIDKPRAYLPGYVLLRPLIIPARQNFALWISAAKTLPQTVNARGMVFTLQSRYVPCSPATSHEC